MASSSSPWSEHRSAPVPEPGSLAGTEDAGRPARTGNAGLGSRAGAALLASLKVAAVALVGYTFLFNFSVVRGNSMAPSIRDGDRILVDQLAYVFDPIQRGDIIVLRYPLDPSIDYIKRVVGMPGDEVRIEGGYVWINGEPLEEPYVELIDVESTSCTHVEPGHYFVLGDNRPRSSDSREFGQVHRDNVRGRVEVRVWPLERLGRI